MSSFMQYLQESIAELRQVRWPTRHQAIRLSLIVVGFTAGTAVLFGVIDFILAELLQVILSFTS